MSGRVRKKWRPRRLIGRLSHVQEGLRQRIFGDANWGAIKTPAGKIYSWDGKSTYVKNPPYFDGMTMTPAPLSDIKERGHWPCWRFSHHRSHLPAGNISKSSPAAKYLVAQGVQAVISTPTVRAAAIMK